MRAYFSAGRIHNREQVLSLGSSGKTLITVTHDYHLLAGTGEARCFVMYRGTIMEEGPIQAPPKSLHNLSQDLILEIHTSSLVR